MTSGEQEDADLLIQQGLSAKLRCREGEGLLNLNDLLAAVQPGLKARIEKRAHFEAPLFGQNRARLPPFPARTRQNVAEIDVFRHAVF